MSLKQLASSGFNDIILALGYMADMLQAYIGDGSKYGLHISCSIEKKPLGTIAPLKLMKNLEENFLVMNGDLLTDINYGKLFDHHINQKARATIATYTKETKLQLGVLKNNSEGRIIQFSEKPVLKNKVSMGIYIFNRSILKYIPNNEYFGFDSLMYSMIENNDRVFSYEFSGKWFDIGMHDDLVKASEEFMNNKDNYLP